MGLLGFDPLSYDVGRSHPGAAVELRPQEVFAMTERRTLTISDAIKYQREHYGCVAYGRDALYALARAGRIPVVRNGVRKLLIPVSSMDTLMAGTTEEHK